MNNIQKNEQGILINQKIRNGESKEQAKEDVKRDVDYINNLKIEISNRKKQIQKLEKEKKKVNEKFKMEFDKLIRKKDKLKKPIKINSSNPTVLHLNRILFCLEEKKDRRIKDIGDYCCMGNKYVKNALNFLLKHELIKEIKDGVITYYSLNKK